MLGATEEADTLSPKKKLKNNKIKLKIVFFSFYFNFPKFLYFTTELYENNLMPLIPF